MRVRVRLGSRRVRVMARVWVTARVRALGEAQGPLVRVAVHLGRRIAQPREDNVPVGAPERAVAVPHD